MTITSRFRSACRRCGGGIRPGQLVDYDRAIGTSHLACPPSRPATQPTAPVEGSLCAMIETGQASAQYVHDWIMVLRTNWPGQDLQASLDAIEDSLRLRWEIELSDAYLAAVEDGTVQALHNLMPLDPEQYDRPPTLTELAQRLTGGR